MEGTQIQKRACVDNLYEAPRAAVEQSSVVLTLVLRKARVQAK